MKKQLIVLLLACALVLSMGAGFVFAEEADQAAADEVQALIEAIYVQERTDETDAQCVAAKEAWDALTDAQKELVEDADYYALDTGDASLDDPRNQDEIGEKELLVVSFGTSFNESRALDIKGIEDALAAAYPDLPLRSSSTMCSPEKANSSTTWSRLWTEQWQMVSKSWSYSRPI